MLLFLHSMIFMKNFVQMVVTFNLYLTIFKKESSISLPYDVYLNSQRCSTPKNKITNFPFTKLKNRNNAQMT